MEVPESLTFILSDFMYPLDFSYSFHRTVHGTSKHDVKAVQVLEESEVALPSGSRGILPLYDYETGAARLLDVSKWNIYNENMELARKTARSRLNRAGIDLVTITPADDWASKLSAFLKRAPSTH